MDFRVPRRDNAGSSRGEGRSETVVDRDDANAIGAVVTTKVRVPHAPSMPLQRLDTRLDAVWGYRLGLVVAPAGSGKTSLLARLAARASGPVGWYRAEGWDAEEAILVRHLEAALSPMPASVPTRWETVADAANALAVWGGERILLVVDDLHTLEGTAAEAALERLVEYAPPTVTIVAGSRLPPRFNLPRLRVSGVLLELSGEDLRFRSWEVERLFRDFYEEPLAPEELARLARRTEGWAAGLQLFHLATSGRRPDERRRLLSELGTNSRLMRETRDYLARNVLAQLPDELRRFLIETSVLGRLSGPLCDRLLGRGDGVAMLEDLERRRLFTQALPEDGAYRYHEILRAHLQGVLLDELGEDRLRERFRMAGELLADARAIPEAVEAYCRAEDWEGARRILGRQGEDVAAEPTGWLDTLPPAIVHQDPWLLLTAARRLRAEGRLQEAAERYLRAEAASGAADPARLSREERQQIAVWLNGSRSPRRDPLPLLRAAVGRDPLGVAREAAKLAAPGGPVVAGLAMLAAGHAASARRELIQAAERPESGRSAQAVAALGAAVAGLLMGQPHAALEAEGAVAAAEASGLDQLARLGRAALALRGSDDALREAQAVADTSAAIGDRWGEALALLFVAWGDAFAGGAPETDRLVGLLRGLDAAVLESWARAIGALVAVRAGEPDARQGAVSAETTARATGVAAARMLAALALGEEAADADDADEYLALARAIALETGLPIPPATSASRQKEGETDGAMELPGPPLAIRLLGDFEIRVLGRPVDLSAIRPRARALLRLLSLNAGIAVHHETIEAALWPEADRTASARNLHVAIAALRRVLEPSAPRGAFQVIRREGDAYRLVAPSGSEVDLVRFERAVASGHLARQQADETRAARLYREGLEWYRGELLPEDGPSEWAAERRELCRLAAVEAAQGLAEILLARGDAAGAARVCTSGLHIERYHDPLWRLLIRARAQAGDVGAANRARLGYDRMLAELGVTPPAPPG